MDKIYTFFAAANLDPGKINYDPSIKNAAGLDTAVGGMLNLVYLVAGMVAVLVIVIAGYMFVMSNGNADRVRRARFMILGASVGLVVVLMAFLITQLVLRWVT